MGIDIIRGKKEWPRQLFIAVTETGLSEIDDACRAEITPPG